MQQFSEVCMALACARQQLLAHVYTFDLDLLLLHLWHFQHCLR